MDRRSRLLVALVFSVSVSTACFSSAPDCFAHETPIVTTGVDGSWELTILENGDGSTLNVSSILFVRISRAPQDTDGGAAAACGGPANVSLNVTYLAGDDGFKDAVMSGVFTPSSQVGDGMVVLQLGDLSVTAAIHADGTVVSTSSSVRNDAGTTMSAIVTLMRTAL
jgi:hypothetical protein